MIIRATAIQRRIGATGTVYVDGRYEIQWRVGEAWLSLGGISITTEVEWLLVASLMMLGARAAGIDFQLINTIPKIPQNGCSDYNDAINH